MAQWLKGSTAQRQKAEPHQKIDISFDIQNILRSNIHFRNTIVPLCRFAYFIPA